MSYPVANANDVAALIADMRYLRSGLFYTIDDADADTTLVMPQDQLFLTTFTVGNAIVANQISLEVTAAGAGSNMDLLLFDSLKGMPNNMLTDQNVSGAAIAIVTAAINLQLNPGLYWLGAVAHTATPPTVRAKSIGGTRWIGQTTAGNANATSYGLSGYTVPGNAPLVSMSQAGSFPKVMIGVQ